MNDQNHPQEGADGDIGYLLTAYADGQLALEGMAWVEEQLDRRPELRARLKEIRAVQAALRAEFARFPAPTELGGFARGEVLAAAQRGRPSTRRQWALAALLVIGVSVSVMAVMVTMGESAPLRTTPLDESTAYSGSVGSPEPALDLVIAEPAGKVEAREKDGESQRQAATLKKEDGDRGETRSSALATGLPSAPPGEGLTDQLAADPAKPASAVPATATPAQPALAVADGRAGGGKRLAGADAVRPAGLPAEPVAQEQRHVEEASGLDQPVEPTGGIAYATVAAAPAPPVAGDAANGLAKPVLVAPPSSSAVSGRAARGGAAAPPAAPYDRDDRILHLEQELALGPAPAEQEALTRSLNEERRNRHTYLRQIMEGAPAASGGVMATGERKTARRRVAEEIHKNLVPQHELLVYDDEPAPSDPYGFLQGAPAAPGQAQSAPALGNADKTRMAQVARATAFPLAEVEDDTTSTTAEPTRREEDLAKLTAQDHDAIPKPDIFKDGPGGPPLLDSGAALGPSATPSQRLAAGNAQRAPRDRVAALLATASVNATAPLATLLRTTAGPDGALAASPALDEILARPAHLETHDLPSGEALLQLARGAGLQARVLGGVVTLDAARGQLDPTDTQGLDRATFTKAFGTVPMVATADDARSTFALDANTASFERARAQLRAGQAPDPAAIQAEHFVNAMPMDYPAAQGPEAFTLYAEAAPSPFALGPADAAVRAPWAGRTAVVAIGAVARPAAPDERRPLHLTLALDCSGSMAQPGGLDRVRLGLEELLTHLRPVDTVAVVAFSDQARVVLPATPGGDPAPIARALAGLTPGGATNAVEGLALAYQLAAEHLEAGTENRVLFATDGGTLAGADAQVVIERVAAYKTRGIALLVVGCGGGAYQGRTLQQLADRAGGQHVFLGSDDEARSAFANRLLPERLAVLAKDAKVQVTWNPQRVSHFRLIGYEQRRLAHQDFRNDAVDAGEISHDTRVTALYEVLLVDGATGPLGSAAVRYFDTRLQQVRELSCPLAGAVLQAEPSQRLRLVACAAEFAAWLQRGWWSNVRPTAPARLLGELARCPQPQARELEELVQRAAALQPQQPIPLNRNATQSNTYAPAAPTDQAAPKP